MASDKTSKRIVVCCDGSWMDTLGAKGGEPQSNVARLARVVRRTCNDGRHQVIMYDAGVGTGVLKLDQYTGGGFGMGLSQNVREAYNFVCSNYVDGDEIILVGFSRGAFTARSVASMIAALGLLTPTGLDYFYHIFEDHQNMASPTYKNFLCPDMEPFGKKIDNKVVKTYKKLLGREKEPFEVKSEYRMSWEDRRRKAYKRWLIENDYSRDTCDNKDDIRIKALAVWDTVGTLGIPPASVIGLQGSADQWKFSNTVISDKVDYAFQALALDEPRDAFKPSLWEKDASNTVTKLKQVWFPGNHGGVGGGWHDQQISNITLAWMCDQLSSIGVEFNPGRLTETFADGLRFSSAHPFPFIANWADTLYMPNSVCSWWMGKPLPWASPDIFRDSEPAGKRDIENCPGDKCKPERHPSDCPSTCKAKLHPNKPHLTKPDDDLWQCARPWALGQICYPSRVQAMIGNSFRHPGVFMQADPETNEMTNRPLANTGERIHSSVRVRLACRGLAMDDTETWKCEPLVGGAKEGFGKKGLWRLERGAGPLEVEEEKAKRCNPVELQLPEVYPGEEALYQLREGDGRYRWVFADEGNIKANGSVMQVPQSMILAEEPLTGYWERYLLRLLSGKVDVWRYAEENAPL